eukprot:2294667-Prymnesium_polylepis.2
MCIRDRHESWRGLIRCRYRRPQKPRAPCSRRSAHSSDGCASEWRFDFPCGGSHAPQMKSPHLGRCRSMLRVGRRGAHGSSEAGGRACAAAVHGRPRPLVLWLGRCPALLTMPAAQQAPPDHARAGDGSA